jgi:hypothetical protein
MASPGPVTLWIAQLKTGERDATQPLWQHYFHQLVVRARHKLAGLPRRAADEEDVALSAFASFCRAAAQGRFPDLHDRDDLWRLLVASVWAVTLPSPCPGPSPLVAWSADHATARAHRCHVVMVKGLESMAGRPPPTEACSV